MHYKGIILDFNGTLIWDTPLHRESWFALCREIGFNLTEREYYNEVHGKCTRDILLHITGRSLDEEELMRLSLHKEELYRQACLDTPDVYRFAPGVESFLDFLAGEGIPRTIATASDRENVDFFIETLGLQRWFDPDLIVYNDGSLAIKPAPDIYLKASAGLKLQPSELVVVEDTMFGVLAAKSAGAGYLIVTGPAEDQHDELHRMEGVRRFISDFDEIDRSLFSA